MAELSLAGLLLLALTAFLVGFSKAGFPGMGILAVPLAAIAVAVDTHEGAARYSSGFLLPMLVAGDVLAVLYWRRKANWKALVKLIPAAVIGVVVGFLLMDRKILWNDRILFPVIGGIVLLMVAVAYIRKFAAAQSGDVRVPQGWWFPAAMGLTGGITTLLGNAAGPIMSLYLLAMRLPKEEFLGTGAWYFLLLNLFKVPFMYKLGLINGTSLPINLMLLPVIIVSGVTGIVLAKRLSEKSFTWVVEGLVIVGAVIVAIKPWLVFK
jgi:uncharacterized membrane protein YfcA